MENIIGNIRLFLFFCTSCC